MALKNQAITVCYVAWNTSTNAGATGDSANHTLKLVQDGTEAAPTNSPAQVDATNAPGVYSLALTAGDMNFNCVVLCGKSSTSNVVIIPLVIVTERGNLDAAVSSRLPTSSYTAPPTAAQNATAVWTDTTAGDFATTSSPGKILVTQLGGSFTTTSSSVYSTASLANAPTGGSAPTAAAIATAVWQDLTAGSDFTTVGSIGKLLATDIDASISSRSTYAGADTAGTTTLLSRLTSTRAGLIDNLDAAISTRATAAGVFDLATTGHTTAGTFGAAVVAAGSAGDPWSTSLPGSYSAGTAGFIVGHNLDAAVSTRSTFAGGAVASVTAAVTVGGYATGQDPAKLVLDATASAHNTAGTIGADIGAAAAGGGGSVTVAGYATGQDPASLILDASTADHQGSGSVGKAISDAATAAAAQSDPLATTVPGDYANGTAGNIIGNIVTGVILKDASITSAKFAVGDSTGPATGIVERIDQLWRRFFKKAVKNTQGTTLKTYADDGITVVTTQVWADDGQGNESLGAAT